MITTHAMLTMLFARVPNKDVKQTLEPVNQLNRHVQLLSPEVKVIIKHATLILPYATALSILLNPCMMLAKVLS